MEFNVNYRLKNVIIEFDFYKQFEEIELKSIFIIIIARNFNFNKFL